MSGGQWPMQTEGRGRDGGRATPRDPADACRCARPGACARIAPSSASFALGPATVRLRYPTNPERQWTATRRRTSSSFSPTATSPPAPLSRLQAWNHTSLMASFPPPPRRLVPRRTRWTTPSTSSATASPPTRTPRFRLCSTRTVSQKNS